MGQSSLLVVNPAYPTTNNEWNTTVQLINKHKTLHLDNGKWDHLNLDTARQAVSQWRVQNLYLNQNRKQGLLHQIYNIEFTQLTFLSIAENNIISIESITRMSMPSLQVLIISKNDITNMQSLRKTNIPKLKYLNISFNKTRQIKKLHELKSRNMKDFKIEDLGQKRQIQDLRWVLKLEATLTRLTCLSVLRIGKQILKKQVKHRFSGVQLKILPTAFQKHPYNISLLKNF